jgi:hypothetical protein
MNRRSQERVEEMLRSATHGARRSPPAELRAQVMTAIATDATAPLASPMSGRVTGALARPSWRERRQDVFVAAAVVMAVGLWVAAFLGVLQVGARPPVSADATAQNEIQAPWSAGLSAIESSPETLSAAVDDSLFGELDDIAQDATRAAQFLVGRLPASLAR